MPADPDRADVENDPRQRALDAMASFRDRARVTNLARVEVIADALDCLRGGVLAEDARLTARRTAHSIVGSAGTFGFGEASQLGRALEALLDEADEADGTETRARAQRGLELVAQLREALKGSTRAEGQPC
jgi:HPt (histidine-containing phosphotransfer) domain-containing protein